MRREERWEGPGFEQREEKSCGDAGEREPVGEPEEFGVQGGEGDEQPAEDGRADDLDEAASEWVRDFQAGGVCGEDWIAVAEPAEGPEYADGELDERVADADGGLARAAAATKDDPTEDGQIFPPGEGVFAVAAVGAGCDDAFALGEAGEKDVEEAAEGQAE